MLDLLLRGGTVYDGTGGPGRDLDVAVAGDRVYLYDHSAAPAARRSLNVDGLFVCPGFVDVHSHSDVALIELPALHDKVCQGITTELIGNCGISPYPPGAPEREEAVRNIVEPVFPGPWSVDWSDTAGYFARVQAVGTDANVGALVGHGTLRAAAMGLADREPTGDELSKMEGLLVEALEQGAMGLSLGLLYPPGCYATAHELTALARVVASHDGVVSCHMRNYLAELMPSLQEVLEVATATGVQLEVSHLMALDQRDAGEALKLLHRARGAGLNVAYDQYPYDRGMTSAQTLLPPWMLADGSGELVRRLQSATERQRAVHDIYTGIAGWDNLVLAVGWDNITLVEPPDHHYCGQPLSEVARQRGCDPVECLFEFLLDTNGMGAMTMRLTDDAALETLLADELGCFGTDGIPRMGNSHPRTFGTYPRILGHYCRDRGVLNWAQAIRKATGEPAARFGLRQRGTLADGNYADIVVFDPSTVGDRSSYLESRPPAGILHVIVNGTTVVEDGRLTARKPGRILRREVQ